MTYEFSRWTGLHGQRDQNTFFYLCLFEFMTQKELRARTLCDLVCFTFLLTEDIYPRYKYSYLRHYRYICGWSIPTGVWLSRVIHGLRLRRPSASERFILFAVTLSRLCKVQWRKPHNRLANIFLIETSLNNNRLMNTHIYSVVLNYCRGFRGV
jgi:hypothetical protein